MPSVNIDDKLYADIKEYCKLNKLTISVFINDLLRKNFMVEKYDDAPPFFKKKEDDKTIKSIIIKDFEPEKFKEEFSADPEPIKKKEYIKPEVISVVEKPKEEEKPSPKEQARKRIQYL